MADLEMALATKELTPRIGTEIFTDPETLVSGAAAAEIRSILDQRGVVLFRGINLTDEQQIAFAATLGEVEEGIFKVTFDKAENPKFAAYLHSTHSWHIDRVDRDIPTLGSILSPRILSPQGGQTEFANTYAAYEDLPAEERDFLDTLQVVHTIEGAFRESDVGEEVLQWARGFEPKTQPLVWRHSSGRKSLAIGISVAGIVGMEKSEAMALIDRLLKWATQPAYVYQHQWQMGDMLMWDNTGTMHRVLPFDHACGRRLHRTTLMGEESLAAIA